jgi:hypothetical protein
MWWAKEKAGITIADLICPALGEGMVREVMWVVPDATLEEPSGRRAVLRLLKKIGKGYPGKQQRAKVRPVEISPTLLFKTLCLCVSVVKTVCTISSHLRKPWEKDPA